MKDPEQPLNTNFFETKTILAVVSAILIMLGWQYYMRLKYPEYGNPRKSVEKTVETTDGLKKISGNTVEQGSIVQNHVDKPAGYPVETVGEVREYQDKASSFGVSSLGFQIQNLTDLEYLSRDGKSMSFGLAGAFFELRFVDSNQLIPFKWKEVNGEQFFGEFNDGQVSIRAELKYSRIDHHFDISISQTALSEQSGLRSLKIVLSDVLEELSEKTLFLPSADVLDFVVFNEGSAERTALGSDNLSLNFPASDFVGFGNQYFTAAFVNKSEYLPSVQVEFEASKRNIVSTLTYVAPKSNSFNINGILYAGPKNMERLEGLHSDLTELMDFGMFSFIGIPLLKLMRWFFGLVGNWGIAIILLTIVVRIIVLPAVLYSQKSMKALSELQPAMKALKEKYKDDNVKQQQEIMALMKEKNANPVSGCLPMLLQFPVFIALFQVLRNSIELYQAPFALWITDLSLMDPYFVLPTLQGLVTYVHMKITPTNADPQYQKVMMFMPVVFTLFMVTLPSGLVLYTFISTLFAVIQQYIITNLNNGQKAAVRI